MNNILKFGKRPVGVYLSNIMEIFESNHKATVEYVESRRGRVNGFFRKLENGGFLISKEYGEEKTYVKVVYSFQTDNNGRVLVEYFPEDDNLRVSGKLPKELRENKKELIRLLEEKGIKQQNKMRFFFREVNKR